MTKLYGPRGTTHSSPYVAAQRSWPDACWIEGSGRFATVAYCRDTTVTLHATYNDARTALHFIDQTGCGGRCHDMHAIYDLAAGPLARIDDLDPEVIAYRAPLHAKRVRTEAVDRGRLIAAKQLHDDSGVIQVSVLFTVHEQLEALQNEGMTSLEDLTTTAAQLWLQQLHPQPKETP